MSQKFTQKVISWVETVSPPSFDDFIILPYFLRP